MQSYTRDELIDVAELSNDLALYLDKLQLSEDNRVVIIKDDKPQAVLIPIEKYEQLMNLEVRIKEECKR